MDGIFNIRKEPGFQSYSVIDSLKKIPGIAKAGYAGTLDNFASGVLLCGVNRATRVLKYLLGLEKEYRAVVVLGRTTDTLDPRGTETGTGPSDYSIEEIEAASRGFTGTFMQTPPVFSSKKIEGRRSSDLAREGRPVEVKPSEITIYSLAVSDCLPGGRFTLTVKCSTGTYIRALARDIGLKLGTVGMLESLERTANGRFKAAEARLTAEIDPARDLISMRDGLYFLEETGLKPEAANKVKNGVPLASGDLISGNLKNGVYKLIFNELLIAIVERLDGRLVYLDNFFADI